MPYSMKVSVHHSSDRSCAEPATFSKSALLPKASSLMQPSAGGSGVDQPESSSSLPLPPPWGSACLQMNPFFFGRSFMPMMPFGPCPMPGNYCMRYPTVSTLTVFCQLSLTAPRTCSHAWFPIMDLWASDRYYYWLFHPLFAIE